MNERSELTWLIRLQLIALSVSIVADIGETDYGDAVVKFGALITVALCAMERIRISQKIRH